jgi:hypothetical protein
MGKVGSDLGHATLKGQQSLAGVRCFPHLPVFFAKAGTILNIVRSRHSNEVQPRGGSKPVVAKRGFSRQ